MPARLASLLAVFIALPVLFVALLAAATVKLYLKSGGDLVVTEYQVQGDRVKYYSAERSQWEEIPLALVDLDRTEKAAERTQKRLESMRAETAAEVAAERKGRTELHNVPIDDGVYYYREENAAAVPQQEVITDGSGKRKILQMISPIPIIAGKKTLYVEGEHSEFAVKETKPIFFVRQKQLTLFGIIKAEPHKEGRVMQIIQTVPKVEEMYEEQEEIEVFRQQLADGVYRVWPVKPLQPGEYAIFDYTPGEGNLRVWSFRVPSDAEASDNSS